MKSINEIASENGLHVIDTTTGLNGYPRALKKAIIGFDDFEQAENDAFERSASDYGENFQQFEANMSQDDFLQQVGASSYIDELADEEDGLDRIEEYMKDLRKLYNAIAKAADDEIVIADGDVYVETIKKKTMQYSYDTKNYVIGLINNNDD